MHGTTKNLSATAAVCIGTLALASAMGIGRFSLTPIMPLMQQDLGLTLPQGSLLATANYLGYLAGALDLRRDGAAAGQRDPLGAGLRRRVHAGDGDDPCAAACGSCFASRPELPPPMC